VPTTLDCVARRKMSRRATGKNKAKGDNLLADISSSLTRLSGLRDSRREQSYD
jgi:hypothetical protein